jgi:MFS family permease
MRRLRSAPGANSQNQDPNGHRGSQLRETKFFGTPAFRRLWFAQLLASLGDWIGIVAIMAIATDVAGVGGLSLVMVVRLGLAFIFAPFAGVIIDRLSRKRIMVMANLGRFAILCVLPFVDTLWGLVLVSVALEIMTSMWSPAKEASVPNLVNKSFLPTANSLSLVAAYGSFPLAAALFAVLSKVPEWVGQSETLAALNLTENSVALYFNALTFLVSAAVIATLTLPHVARKKRDDGRGMLKSSSKEAFEGLQFVRTNRKVRGVVFGLAAGLIGGGSVVPLGVIFANDVLSAGSGGYGLLLTSLGIGVALGVVSVTLFQKRIPVDRLFTLAVGMAGAALALAASMNGLGAAAMCVGVLGICAGAVYVLGFTSLQLNVTDEIRGRVFATFYMLTRVCILLAVVFAPIVAGGLDHVSQRLFDGQVEVVGSVFMVPGVRLTLWLGAAIILVAALFASRQLSHRADDGQPAVAHHD